MCRSGAIAGPGVMPFRSLRSQVSDIHLEWRYGDGDEASTLGARST
jgi:hypothetical protein